MTAVVLLCLTLLFLVPGCGEKKEYDPGPRFDGVYFKGNGDVEYLEMLETCRSLFDPNPEYQYITMLYQPHWNGFVEGFAWNAWWVQNSFGPSYCALPILEEPSAAFLRNANKLWFDRIGDGTFAWSYKDTTWVVPDGALMDAASPDFAIYKQGDGRTKIHDWCFEFTAAGGLVQSELLLVERDTGNIRHYLPYLERCADFIETRRDPETDLFLVGPAANLLAPSYAGWHQADGTYEKAYLTGLSITHTAFLDRLIELEKMAGNTTKAESYTSLRDRAKAALVQLVTEDGYFIRYLDPDGTKHGVIGAETHGYFEAVCNHDAMCFRIADDEQCRRIYDTIASLPDIRPHGLILTNYPGLDDMYDITVDSTNDAEQWLWKYGTWVNGGHWTTCEARMIMGYYRVGAYEDARNSYRQFLPYMRTFKMDNPLPDFGHEAYHNKELINLCYDNYGLPAAMVRGLFEYLYSAEGLTLIPHIPDGITILEQHFPVRFGDRKLFLAVYGTGPIEQVEINGVPWENHTADTLFLPDDDRTPDYAAISIIRNRDAAAEFSPEIIHKDLLTPSTADVDSLIDRWFSEDVPTEKLRAEMPSSDKMKDMTRELYSRMPDIAALVERLEAQGMGDSEIAAHARLCMDAFNVAVKRANLQREGSLKPLRPGSEIAANKSYIITAERLIQGIGKGNPFL